jgi:hypothetical protein
MFIAPPPLGFLFHYGRWEMGFNDPNPTGWIVTLLYMAALACCIWAARVEREHETSSTQPLWPRFWVIACWIIGVLGVNKQLDLQSLLTEIGRDLFRAVGLYEERRGFQMLFVVLLALVGVAAIVAGRISLGGFWRRYRMAYIGGCCLIVFVVVRGASFHHVDTFLYHTGSLKYWVNTLLEAGGISTVIAAACLAARQKYQSKYKSFQSTVRIR